MQRQIFKVTIKDLEASSREQSKKGSLDNFMATVKQNESP
jgi:hypothetical protein